MEAEICCAYNATRGCKLSSKVTVADSALEPLKVLKILVEGLSRDGESSLWLTPLKHAPNLTRLFPFDFAYLDGEHRVIHGVALLPGVQTPQFTDQAASALVLPLETLVRTNTQQGDQIIVCVEKELEARIAEISVPMTVASVTHFADNPGSDASLPVAALPKLPQHPLPGLRVSAPTLTASVPRGTGFTAAMTAGWQISSSTTVAAAAAVLEPIETRESVQDEEAESVLAVLETAIATEIEGTDAMELGGTTGSIANPVSGHVFEPVVDQVSEPVCETVAAVEVAESNRAERVVDSLTSVAAEEAVVEQPRVSPDVEETVTEVPTPQRKKLAEKAPASAANIAIDADPVTTRKKTREQKKKESLGVLVKRFLNCEDPLPERRSIIRLLAQGLVACGADRENTKTYDVRDVSPTGLYLRTEERWRPGDVVSLVLQRRGSAEEDYERRVNVEARVVRCDEGGVGLLWLWPEGVEFQPWKRVHTKRSDETDADYFLRELRLTTALGFLRQICPSSADEMKMTLHQRLSNKRIASAVEIVLKAQDLLGQPDGGASKLAHPDMVRRIVENGSWTEDDWIRQRWAGLLASSCSAEAPDTSNTVFIDLLAKLMPAHLHVLSFVCRKASERIEAGAPAATLDVYCTSEELIQAVGSPSLARIQQTMGQLSSLGLLAESNKPSYVAVTDKVKTRTTPTALGLKMFARCHGRQS